MRRPVAILALGLLGLLLEGALAAELPPRFVPDFTLLVPIAAALALGPVEGLLVAATIGLAADALSGSLLGQQALLRVLEFGATRLVGAQLDLRRPLPLVAFTAVVGVIDAVGMAWLSRIFLDELRFSVGQLAGLAVRVGVNAVFAPFVAALVRTVVDQLGEFEARREMRLDTRRPAV